MTGISGQGETHEVFVRANIYIYKVGLTGESPWYNRTGWLGVKHQVTYLTEVSRLVSNPSLLKLLFVVGFGQMDRNTETEREKLSKIVTGGVIWTDREASFRQKKYLKNEKRGGGGI